MKKAIIVEYNFATRIIIDEADENLVNIVRKSRGAIRKKVAEELVENLSEWYDDEEMPYSEEDELI